MPRVVFTSHLQRHVRCAESEVGGATVGAALAAVFSAQPQVRGYVLDDRGSLRKHVCVFADGRRLPREATLSHPIRPNSELYVMQALSGG